MAKHIHIHLPSKKTVVDRKVKDAVPEYTYEAVMKKIREGQWEAENDVEKGKTISIVKYPSKQRVMIRVKDSFQDLIPWGKSKGISEAEIKASYEDWLSYYKKKFPQVTDPVKLDLSVKYLVRQDLMTYGKIDARKKAAIGDATEPKYLLKRDAAVPPNKGWKGKTLVNGDIVVRGSTVIYKSGSGFVPWYNRNATPMRFSPSDVIETTFDTADTQDSEENDAYIQGYNDALAGKPKDKEFHPGGNKKPSVTVKYAEGHKQGTEDRKSKSGKDDGQTLGIRA